MSEPRRIPRAGSQGDQQAAADLLPKVYQELRQLAAQKLAHEPPGQPLQATGLVHEAYLRLVDQNEPQEWDNRRHFFAAAAEAMRRILIENARSEQSLKRGGHMQRTHVDQSQLTGSYTSQSPEELLDLDEALTRLAETDSEAAELVKLRYFSGLTHKEAAEVLDIPRRSADRLWAYARAWLHRELYGQE